MSTMRFASIPSNVIKRKNVSILHRPVRSVQIDFEQIFDVDKQKLKKEIEINYLQEEYTNWLLKNGETPKNKPFLELHKNPDGENKSPIENHVDFLAGSFQFDKITEFLVNSSKYTKKSVMVEKYSNIQGWVRYDYNSTTDEYETIRVNYPDEEILFLLPHHLYHPKNEAIKNTRDYVFHKRPQIVWAVGRDNRFYHWTSPIGTKIEAKFREIMKESGQGNLTQEVVDKAMTHVKRRFNLLDAYCPLNYNKTKYIVCDKPSDKSFFKHTDRNVQHREDFKFGNHARIWKNSPLQVKPTLDSVWIPQRNILKRLCTLGTHANDEQLFVTQQRIFIGEKYFTPDAVLNFNYPSSLMWYRKGIDCIIYSNSLLSNLMKHFETIWPLYIQSFAENPVTIYGDIMSTSGHVILNSDKQTNTSVKSNAADRFSSEVDTIPVELSDESYASEQKNKKLLSFIQNYFTKTNLDQTGDGLTDIPFKQENELPSANPELSVIDSNENSKKLNMINASSIGMEKMVNSQKLYQCQFDNKNQLSDPRAMPNMFNNWVLPQIAYGRTVESVFTLEDLLCREQTFGDTVIKFTTLTPLLARIKFFESYNFEISMPNDVRGGDRDRKKNKQAQSDPMRISQEKENQTINWTTIRFLRDMSDDQIIAAMAEDPEWLNDPENHWKIGRWEAPALNLDYRIMFKNHKPAIEDPTNPLHRRFLQTFQKNSVSKAQKLAFRFKTFPSMEIQTETSQGNNFKHKKSTHHDKLAAVDRAFADERTIHKHTCELNDGTKIAYPYTELKSQDRSQMWTNNHNLNAELMLNLTKNSSHFKVDLRNEIDWVRAVIADNMVNEDHGAETDKTFGTNEFSTDFWMTENVATFDAGKRIGIRAIELGPRIVDFFQTELKPDVFHSLTRVGERIVVSEEFFANVRSKVGYIDFLPRRLSYLGGTDSRLFQRVTCDEVQGFLGGRGPTNFNYEEHIELGDGRGVGIWRDWPINSSLTDLLHVHMLLFQDINEKLELGIQFIGIDERTVHYQLVDSNPDKVKMASDWCMVMAKAYILSLHGYDKIPLNGLNLSEEMKE